MKMSKALTFGFLAYVVYISFGIALDVHGLNSHNWAGGVLQIMKHYALHVVAIVGISIFGVMKLRNII